MNELFNCLYLGREKGLDVKVIVNDRVIPIIVIWKDGSKTVVKCQKNDEYDPEKGLALCFMKKALGNKGNFNNILKKELPLE